MSGKATPPNARSKCNGLHPTGFNDGGKVISASGACASPNPPRVNASHNDSGAERSPNWLNCASVDGAATLPAPDVMVETPDNTAWAWAFTRPPDTESASRCNLAMLSARFASGSAAAAVERPENALYSSETRERLRCRLQKMAHNRTQVQPQSSCGLL
jgi:hypothetical protein